MKLSALRERKRKRERESERENKVEFSLFKHIK
jgi:hypothetical protein